MMRKILFALAAMIAAMGIAFAQVEANKADQTTLDTVKGIGPAMSKRIIEERKKGGDFKDWNDFEKRVKGIGDKNSTKLSEAGLTVNGQSKPGTSATKSEKKSNKESKQSGSAASKGESTSQSQGAGASTSDTKK